MFYSLLFPSLLLPEVALPENTEAFVSVLSPGACGLRHLLIRFHLKNLGNKPGGVLAHGGEAAAASACSAGLKSLIE